ncbi:unnamed protein product [Pylaiella littoralis]
MAAVAVGNLSATEKKTIEFGLAVAILASCPSSSSPPAGQALEGCSSSSSSSSSARRSSSESCEQRASKQLKLWQGACLGGLAHAGSRARRRPTAAALRQQENGLSSAGGRRGGSPCDDTSIVDVPAEETEFRNEQRDQQRSRCLDAGGGLVPPAAEPMRRLLARDGASDLRALGAVAFSGCRSERARAVQKEALEGIWHGDCSPGMVSLFATEMLEQVVLHGHGGSGQVYRHVLNLMVFIVEDVAVAASLVGAAAVKTAKPSPKPNRSNNDENARAPLPSPAAAASALGRRLDVALAVSQAFDATLLHLARELRRGTGTSTGRGQGVWGSKGRSGGRHEGSSTSASSFHRRRPDAMAQSQLQSAAIVRAAGAGLYLDAYETAVACLLRAFSCLAEGDPERQEKLGSSPPPFSDEPHGPDQHQTLVETRRGGRRSSDENARFGVQERGEASDASNRPTTSKGPVEKGFVPRGWDAEVRRNVWAQRKLEVLAEATTTMSSFRMGQLRLQRVVARLYEWARLA